MEMMHETKPQEVWRSWRELILVRADEEKPSSKSSGGSNQISKTGAVHYLLENEGYGDCLQEMVRRYHSRSLDEEGIQFTRCSSVFVQLVEVPVSAVWSLVRRFDEPQIYNHFVRSCFIRGLGDLKVKVGCLREVRVVSGLPPATSTERLDVMDEKRHIVSFSIVGGDHKLSNYRSITSLHERLINGKPGTIVIESYAVDSRHGNTKKDTHVYLSIPLLNAICSPWLTSPSATSTHAAAYSTGF